MAGVDNKQSYPNSRAEVPDIAADIQSRMEFVRQSLWSELTPADQRDRDDEAFAKQYVLKNFEYLRKREIQYLPDPE